MDKVLIVVGTMYGNALDAAQVCQKIFTGKGVTSRITEQADLNAFSRDPEEVILVCTSSTGMGDIPDNLMPLFCELMDERPNLAGRHYAVLGLGDSSYQKFNGAARQMDALLNDLGATRLGEIGVIDASIDPYPEKPAERWAKSWLKSQRGSLWSRLGF